MQYRTKPRSYTGRALRWPAMFVIGAFTLAGCGSDEPQSEAMMQSDETTQSSTASAETQEQVAQPATSEEQASAEISLTGTNEAAGEQSAEQMKEEATSEMPAKIVPASNTESAPDPVEKQAETGDNKNTAADPAIFDALLKTNVSNGKVNYSGFRNSSAFTGYLESIAGTSLDGMSTNEKLAFWVNAYNALVIKNVLDNPGIKQPLDVPGFFDKKKFTAAGRSVTLNQIENDIIRPTFREPLIHFGLVCAARSCPPLINRAYTAANVRSQLAANARAYLADTKQNRFADGTLYLSKIFEWYKADFGGDEAGLRAFAKQYGPASMKDGIQDATPVAFNEYDWTLNGK